MSTHYKWKCPKCGLAITSDAPHTLSIHCSVKCGFVDHTEENISEVEGTGIIKKRERFAQCPHHTEEFRLETCPSCRGNVQIKIFKCDLHGECTMAKKIKGVHVCDCGAIP